MWSIPFFSSLKSQGGQRRVAGRSRLVVEYLEDRCLLTALTETGVSPVTGPATTAIVQVSGTGFETGAQVFFGSKLAVASGSQSSTLLTVVVPNIPPGPTDVRVANPDGGQVVLTGAFFALPPSSVPTTAAPPVVTSIFPSSGPAAGGTTVQITGTGFQAGSKVFFGSVPATVVGIPTATTITVTTPALPVGPADVKVVNPDGLQTIVADGFSALAAPTAPAPVIVSISPTSGPPAGGTLITITGTGFQATSQVIIGGVAATISGIPTPTNITAVTPVLLVGTYDVKVVNSDGQASVLPAAFTVSNVTAPPVIANVLPHFAHTPGAVVQIVGSGFQTGSKVFFGAVAVPISGNPTSTTLTVVVPALPIGSTDVTIVNPDGKQTVAGGAFFAMGGGTGTGATLVISSINPNIGPATGGSLVQITGGDFEPGSQVFIGGVLATISGVPTDSSVTVIAPPLPIGPADVKIIDPDGQVAVVAGGFAALAPSLAPPPVITAVNAGPSTSGLTTGGATVQISGTGFVAGSKVFIGGSSAPLSSLPTGTLLTVTAPPLPVGAADIKVVNPDGQESVLKGAFVVVAPPPVITSVSTGSGSSASGPAAGGTIVKISGTGFQTDSQVFIGGIAAAFSASPTATLLTVVAPALPVGPADVKVLNSDGQKSVLAGAFNVTPNPVPLTIGNVLPHFAHTPGAVITISGTGFQPGSQVFLGGVLVTVSGIPTATSISVVTPALPIGATDVKIINPDGTQITSAGAFFAMGGGSVSAPPVVTNVSPGFGPITGGTAVVITGTGFQPGSQVFFGGVAAAVSGIPTATSITVITPVLPVGPADVKIVNPDGQQVIAAGAFVAQATPVLPPPVVSSITPATAPAAGGTTITLSGTGFQATSKVFIGGIAASLASLPSATSISVFVPALPVGVVDVKIVNADGQFSLLPGALTITSGTTPPVPGAPPVVEGVSPNAGPKGTLVQIFGTGFQAGSQATIGGVAAPQSGTPTSTTLTVVAPKLPAGPADVAVVNPDGQKSVLPGSYFAT
jgi:hypothetical protein